MKGQVSTELMVIIGIILVIFIPLLVTIYMKADETQNEMASVSYTHLTLPTIYSV